MKRSIINAIIGIIGYYILFTCYGWKLALGIFLINWCINLERNNYIIKIIEDVKNNEKL
ncbi:MAG: hypothetical protein WC346_17985 [Methanogenium sp.]|jgi:hypothetical protein